MSTKRIDEFDELTSVDRAADMYEVADASDSNNSKRSSVNSMLDLTSHPVGETETQTLTNKTLAAPTVSDPVLSGTLTGTYTLGGTPTFPSAVVTLTGSQTLTNKVLTSPTINAPTITNPTLTTDTVSEFTSANGVTVDGLNIKDSKLNTNNSVVTNNITDSAVTNAKVATGFVVQEVSTASTAFASGTTTIPLDDTIPQISEGTEFMTQTITPKSATNILVISVIMVGSVNATTNLIGAIFQDSTANALAAATVVSLNTGNSIQLSVRHIMTAGTTSATTFRFRAGGSSASTVTFNGRDGARLFGAITKSSITVTEYKA